MLDQLTRVSPPQTDSLKKNHRTEKLEDLGAKNLKSNFKDHLKEQIKKEQAKDDQKDLRAEKKESQPGENKKKVAKKNDTEPDNEKAQLDKKNDPTMISMNMVSVESEVEIPDESLNLAMIEESKINLTENLSATDLINQIQPEPVKAQDVSSLDVAGVENIDSEVTLEPALVPTIEPAAAQMIQAEELPTPMSSAFQDKIMDALKKEKFDQPELKMDQLKENISAQQSETVVNSKNTANSDSQFTDQDTSSKDSKSLKEDFIKSELMKSESNHTGQSEFRTQLSSNDTANVKGTESVVKPEMDSEPGVKELLSQANYLVTQGGGEVTLKMNSTDVMGEVHLKVMMENGKLNIELNTQDKSVKKLIEDSLSELRSSLAAQQISLEHVKINSVNAVNTENNSAALQNGHQQAGSESNQSKTFDQMQQQMQQQKNQNQQRSFSNTLLNEDRPVVLPLKSVQKSAASQYYGLNKAQGLNTVA